ncbi:MAG: hypothetical protein IPJ61_21675 [Tessaracoccus sp.]|uniref:hypothetical protein n=1 Tax=Tessaracoccus sp. TaxID=1971211 RepID=UPI001EC00C9A|nr:hypothetical protein [Tessaracoccus sp.]MBK7823600.1 hypothetical protein [Tessaracoccus sp.]
MSVTVPHVRVADAAHQRSLPRLINYGRWRHPVFSGPRRHAKRYGDLDTWVYQTPNRVGWWWQTAEGEIPAAMTRTGQALDSIAEQIAARVNKAAKVQRQGHSA